MVNKLGGKLRLGDNHVSRTCQFVARILYPPQSVRDRGYHRYGVRGYHSNLKLSQVKQPDWTFQSVPSSSKRAFLATREFYS